MSDTSPTSSESDDSRSTSGAPDGTKKDDKKDDLVSRAELDDAIRSRQIEKEKRRELEKKLDQQKAEFDSQFKTLTSQLEEYTSLKKKQEDDAAAARGDIEAIRASAKAREEELLGKIASIEGDFRKKLESAQAEVSTFRDKYLLENEVMRVLGDVTVDPEAAFLLLKDKFELADEDGQLKPRVKDSTLSIRDWTERTLESRGKHYMLKNQRRPGSGVAPEPAKSPGQSKAQSIPTDLASWSKADRLKWIRENPELAKQQRDEAMKKL